MSRIPENGGLPLFTFGKLSNLGAATTIPSDKASDVFQVTENMTIDGDSTSYGPALSISTSHILC